MSLETQIPFERHQPSVDLRAFLDPLKPGSYFDCGEARLYGIDEALEAEAIRRSRPVGDDEFQLVATDGGLIFCRASITFAIAARWKDLVISRPEEGEPDDKVLLPIAWPTHGDLQFTVSRRLGSNIFRRWLQIQAQATRRSQVEQDVRFEQTRRSTEDVLDEEEREIVPEAEGATGPDQGASAEQLTDGAARTDTDVVHTTAAGPQKSGMAAPTIRLDDSDREAIQLATSRVRRRESHHGRQSPAVVPPGSPKPPTPTGTAPADPVVDEEALDSWIDDRGLGFDGAEYPTADPRLDDEVDPYDRHDEPREVRNHSIRFEPRNGGRPSANDEPIIVLDDDGGARIDEVDENGTEPDDVGGRVLRRADGDAAATQFMKRTADGTEIYPDESARNRYLDGLFDPADGESGDAGDVRRKVKPVPEIAGARLQRATFANDRLSSPESPSLDIRSTLLAGGHDADWIISLRRHRVPILAAVTVLALLLIVILGLLSGGDDDAAVPTVADTIDIPSRNTDPARSTVGVAPGEFTSESGNPSIPTTNPPAGDEPGSTLRVTSTSVQICHSNYGGCVPVAADVDCVGDGDGPAFQTDPVAVFGDDVYDLDTDDDRQACEPGQPPASVGDLSDGEDPANADDG